MADKKDKKQDNQGTQVMGAGKRAASMSVKKKGDDASANKGKAAKKSNTANGGLGLGAKIVIVFFAVLMALSLMLPSLSAVFSAMNSSDASTEQTNDATTDDSASTDDSTDAEDSTTDSADTDSDSTETDFVAQIDETYTEATDELLAKYDTDPTNLATLLNLGKNYMTWGVYVRSYGSTDADTSHAYDLLENAVKYYDEYLEQRESSAVRCDRALCYYYKDEGNEALSQLKSLTESDPEYGPAWANLGMLYEASGDEDSAREAYAKAEETDPNDEYGAKSYAEQRVSALDSADSDDSSSTTSTDSSSSTSDQGLSETLGSLSGTSL